MRSLSLERYTNQMPQIFTVTKWHKINIYIGWENRKYINILFLHKYLKSVIKRTLLEIYLFLDYYYGIKVGKYKQANVFTKFNFFIINGKISKLHTSYFNWPF